MEKLLCFSEYKALLASKIKSIVFIGFVFRCVLSPPPPFPRFDFSSCPPESRVLVGIWSFYVAIEFAVVDFVSSAELMPFVSVSPFSSRIFLSVSLIEGGIVDGRPMLAEVCVGHSE